MSAINLLLLLVAHHSIRQRQYSAPERVNWSWLQLILLDLQQYRGYKLLTRCTYATTAAVIWLHTAEQPSNGMMITWHAEYDFLCSCPRAVLMFMCAVCAVEMVGGAEQQC